MFAGTFVEVLSSGTVPKCAAQVLFRLQAPETESDADLISATIRALKGEPAVAETVGGGSILAKLSEAAHPEVCVYFSWENFAAAFLPEAMKLVFNLSIR